MTFFAFKCETEKGLVITSTLEEAAWKAVEELVVFLIGNESNSKGEELFSWKKEKGHQANAKETYAWRNVIESIKTIDLESLSSDGGQEKEGSVSGLRRSRPIMLRVAGDITNALIHSYDNRHRITFFQIDDVEPS